MLEIQFLGKNCVDPNNLKKKLFQTPDGNSKTREEEEQLECKNATTEGDEDEGKKTTTKNTKRKGVARRRGKGKVLEYENTHTQDLDFKS